MGYKLKSKVSLKEVFEKIGIAWQSEEDYSIDDLYHEIQRITLC